MEQTVQSLDLEREAAVRKSSEHLEKIRRLSDCSQQEVNELREQLDNNWTKFSPSSILFQSRETCLLRTSSATTNNVTNHFY